jgi:hypothetical protein
MRGQSSDSGDALLMPRNLRMRARFPAKAISELWRGLFDSFLFVCRAVTAR